MQPKSSASIRQRNVRRSRRISSAGSRRSIARTPHQATRSMDGFGWTTARSRPYRWVARPESSTGVPLGLAPLSDRFRYAIRGVGEAHPAIVNLLAIDCHGLRSVDAEAHAVALDGND